MMSSNIFVKKVVCCPKCKKEVTYLRESRSRDDSGSISIDSHIDNIISGMNHYPLRKSGNYGKPSFNADDDICWYCCPKCHEEIANSHDDAVRLLNGEQLLEEY